MIKKILKKITYKVGLWIPNRVKMDGFAAKKILEDYSQKPKGTCYKKNNVEIKYGLQVIIPVYNAEKWIRECLNSVFQQNPKYTTLVTIVNDGSTDETAAILKEATSRQSWGGGKMTVEVITQENRGYSGARNAALQTLKGEYILFLDSDDFLPENAINQMLDAAHKWNADILQGSWYTFDEKEKKLYIVPTEGVLNEKKDALSGFPWGKLYKYTILENFRFPAGFWFEDTPISFILFAMPYRFAAIKEIVYGYRLNPNGITALAVHEKKSLDTYWITEECLEEFTDFNLKYDQRAYEYILRQSVMNWRRLNKHPQEIQKAVFVETGELIKKYFPSFQTNETQMKEIEKMLREKRFTSFKMIIRGM